MCRLGWILVFGLFIVMALATDTSSQHRQSSAKRRASTHGHSRSTRQKSSNTAEPSKLTLPSRPKQTYLLPSPISVYSLGSDGKYARRAECKKDQSKFATLADVLAYCVAQLNLKAVPTQQWRFFDVEHGSMINHPYSHDDSAAVLVKAVNAEGNLKIQLWQWKDVNFTVEYKRLLWSAPILPDRFYLTEHSSLRVDALWRLKFPGSIMEAGDIDVFVHKTGRPDTKKPFQIDNNGKPMFLLHAAYSVGEPLTLLLVEKEQQCGISHNALLMDRNIVKKTRCNQRFLMTSWLQTSVICTVCKTEICDLCETPIESDIKKFPCGHVFHRDCATGSNNCRKCLSVFFDVTLPSGEKGIYQIRNRHNANEAKTTPAAIIKHFLGDEEVPQALTIQLTSGFSNHASEVSADTELLRVLKRKEQPYSIKFNVRK